METSTLKTNGDTLTGTPKSRRFPFSSMTNCLLEPQINENKINLDYSSTNSSYNSYLRDSSTKYQIMPTSTYYNNTSINNTTIKPSVGVFGIISLVGIAVFSSIIHYFNKNKKNKTEPINYLEI